MIDFYELKKRNRNISLQYSKYDYSFWLSEMDILPPKDLLEVLDESFHSGLGYSVIPDSISQTVFNWFSQYSMPICSNVVLNFSPSVLYTIKNVLNISNITDEDVVLLTPTFGEYKNIINTNLVKKVSLDSDWLEELNNVKFKAVIICNPNNPTGKVFSYSELQSLIKVCEDKNAWIISDEVYMDYTFGKPFTPIHSFHYDKLISVHSIGKTFNSSGIRGSFYLTQNRFISNTIQKKIKNDGLSNIDVLYISLISKLYTSGAPWILEVKELIESNYSIIKNNLEYPLKCNDLEGTYCIMIDFSLLNKHRSEVDRLLKKDNMKVYMGDHFILSDENNRFFRLNLACSNKKIKKALEIINRLTK